MFGRRDSPAKALDRANRLALKGDLPKAISLLEQHLASHADDDRALLKLGDLLRKTGDGSAAASAFSRAADLYAPRGFALKAAASLRQAVSVLPTDLALRERLAELNAELGLARDAARGLEEVAAAVALAGDRPRLLALRRRILSLLPGDVAATLRLADLLAEDGQREQAVALLEEAASGQQGSPRSELWLLLQERLCTLQPGNTERARDLARAFLSTGSPRRALARLKLLFAAAPSDVEVLQLLAQAFTAIGQHSKAGAAWRELAHALLRAGRAPETRAAWEKVLEFIPGDAEATTAVAPPPLPERKAGTTLDEELAEADFLAAHDGELEARAVLLRLRGLFPDSSAVRERLEALDIEEVAPEELIEEEPLVQEEESRDSTTAILDRVPPDRVPRVEEGAMHRDLAVAFLEMERYDEALGELAKAVAVDPPREHACLALAGRCHLARGAPRDAVDAYRRALASTTLPFEAAAAIHYELGEALETLGEEKEALAHFREAEGLEPGFRAVGRRIAGLGG